MPEVAATAATAATVDGQVVGVHRGAEGEDGINITLPLLDVGS